MSGHPLDPLLKPGSIALLGASDRIDSPGHNLADMVINSAFPGVVYPVNPRCEEILGARCYRSLDQLPEPVDHVVIGLGNAHLERALDQAIIHGARAATIYSSGILGADVSPNLLSRLKTMATDAGIAVCGGNGMGFYNVSHDLFAGIFPKPRAITRGGISYIAQSGSAFTTLCHNGCRLGFNLCVSSGNEMVTTVSDYMDWSLEQDDTRVIGLFLETVRDPAGFVRALEKANAKDIPVVILKIGRSPLAAQMALTHTGAMAGNHTAYEALFRKYGVIEVRDLDEMAAILMLLECGRETGEGSLAAAFESGGFRELFSDLAHELGVEFADVEETTRQELGRHLDPGLTPENPLDLWGSHERFEERFLACMRALMRDPKVAGGVFVSNFRDHYYLSKAIYRVVETVSGETDKPVALSNIYSDLANEALCQRAFKAGIPLIDGARETLLAFRHLFDYQRFKRTDAGSASFYNPDPELVSRQKAFIEAYDGDSIGEADALAMLRDFSVPVVEHRVVSDPAALAAAAVHIGYPLVLKTAAPGVNHKSDVGGVIVGIHNPDDLAAHYADLSTRLGPQVLLSKMVDTAIEVAVGTFNDSCYGPVIMVAAGGLLVEILSDRAVAMCPVSPGDAHDLILGLKISALLDDVRGQGAVNKSALIDAIVRLSEFAWVFRNQVAEIDVNPLIVNTETAVAVDALIVRQ